MPVKTRLRQDTTRVGRVQLTQRMVVGWAARGSGKSDLDNFYKLLLEYDRVYRGTASTGGDQPRPVKLPDSYPKGDINSLLGLEDH